MVVALRTPPPRPHRSRINTGGCSGSRLTKTGSARNIASVKRIRRIRHAFVPDLGETGASSIDRRDARCPRRRRIPRPPTGRRASVRDQSSGGSSRATRAPACRTSLRPGAPYLGCALTQRSRHSTTCNSAVRTRPPPHHGRPFVVHRREHHGTGGTPGSTLLRS